MSFLKYIAGRRVTDTPAGDFVRDAKQDRSLPDAKEWSELHRYLLRKGASSAAIDAARRVWQGYRRSIRSIRSTRP